MLINHIEIYICNHYTNWVWYAITYKQQSQFARHKFLSYLDRQILSFVSPLFLCQ
jgi:hypothetical protein